jgi:CAAX prenyl protease-like protein
VAADQSQSRALRYVLPFAVFMAILAARGSVHIPEVALHGLWVAIIAVVLAVFSRPVIDLRLSRPAATIAMGVAVFVIWIAPDLLFPNYRSSRLFQNQLTGVLSSGKAEAYQNWLIIGLRIVRAVILVPILEELFWRGFLMRWIVRPDFEAIPLGTYEPRAFWITALLFASEHGPYWDVGLAAGVLYNWWIIRTRRLGDLIWAHAVTNGCLCIYVVAAQKWEYWM